MGAACCVAAKDRTIVSGPSGETLQRNVRYSPSWSFRWDNRGRVAGEETQENWLHDRGGGNSQVEVKYGTAVEISFASEEDNTLNNLPSYWQKPPVFDESAGVWRLPISDDAMSRNLVEAKGLPQSSPASHPSPVKLSPSGPSLSTSPQSSQSHLLPPKSTPSRCHRHSPRHQLYKPPTFSVPRKASYESTRGTNDGSSNSWSIPISELTTTRRERWSFDSENSGFILEKISSNGRNSGSPIDLQTCSVCTQLLTERSSWESINQKIVSATELSVVSVLSCGHVYHAECLEYLTPEINKYDPTCPVCTLGEKQTVMIRPEKASKAKMVAKAKKRSSKHEVCSQQKSNLRFDRHRIGVEEETGPKISSGKPFLKRHFSFSSRAGKSSPENQSAHRKGFFWSRSSKG